MEVTMIPAAKIISADTTDKYHQLKVAAYCRVSTEQRNSKTATRSRLIITPTLLIKIRNGSLQAYSLMKEFREHRPKSVLSSIR